MLRVRLTEEQRRAFEEAAKKDDREMSSFVRQAAIERARQLGVKI